LVPLIIKIERKGRKPLKLYQRKINPIKAEELNS
jgi:hypothetical protein